MAEIRAKISEAEVRKHKRYQPVGFTYQKHLDTQNETIRQLQLELGRLGVAGAALERK